MSNSDQMLLELDELLPEAEETLPAKVSKKRAAKKEEATAIEVPPTKISVVEAAEPAPPPLSPQTLAEMEAGRKALQNY